MKRFPSLPYVAPFCILLLLLVLAKYLTLPPLIAQSGFVLIMLVALAVLSPRKLEEWRVKNWPGTLLVGVGVFLIWIAPDVIFSGYRHLWLFDNRITGTAATGLSSIAQSQAAVLCLRAFRAVAIVPLAEELFWRGWLMRWLISPEFDSIPLGTWSAQAFWLVALLFAAEHGPYWDVGLAAGVLYNWWMLRTRSLGDLAVAHAVTNACLSAYVVAAGKWEYWL